MSAFRKREGSTGRHVDESGVAPSSKAYTPPLAPVPDHLRVRVELDRHHLAVDGRAKVGRGIHAPVNYAVVCLLAAGVGGSAAALCRWGHAGGLATLSVAGGAFLLVFFIGLTRMPATRD